MVKMIKETLLILYLSFIKLLCCLGFVDKKDNREELYSAQSHKPTSYCIMMKHKIDEQYWMVGENSDNKEHISWNVLHYHL